MSDESRERFRAKYRAKISPYYSGGIHLMTLCTVAGGLMWFALSNLNGFEWVDLWIVPIAIIGSNIARAFALVGALSIHVSMEDKKEPPKDKAQDGSDPESIDAKEQLEEAVQAKAPIL